MTFSLTTAARSTLISTLAAFVLAAAVPQAGFARTGDAGLWKVNPAQTKFRGSSGTLTLEPSGQEENASGNTFVVIANGKIYLANPPSGVGKVDYSDWQGMNLVQIGSDVRAVSFCGYRCKLGLPEKHLTVTFTALKAGEQAMSILASGAR